MDLFCLLLNGRVSEPLVHLGNLGNSRATEKRCRAKAVQGVTASVRQPYVMSMYQGSFLG